MTTKGLPWILLSLALAVGCSETDDGDPIDLGAGDMGGQLDQGSMDSDISPDEGVEPDQTVPDLGPQPFPDVGPVDPPDASSLECPPDSPNIHTVTGRVLNDEGRGMGDTKVQICVRLFENGELLCLRPSDTRTSGQFLLRIGESARCMTSATLRILKPLTDHATAYCHLPDGEGLIEIADPFTLYRTTRASTLPPEGDKLTIRTVEFANVGVQIDVVPDLLYSGGAPPYEMLAATKIQPGDPRFCLVEESPFDGIIAFSPELDIEDTPAPLRIQTELAPGTQVDLYVLGGLSCLLADGTLVEEGTWAQFASTTVGDAGLISVDDDEGIPCLNYLAWQAQ